MTTIRRLLNSGESRVQKAARRKKLRSSFEGVECLMHTRDSLLKVGFGLLEDLSSRKTPVVELPLSECTPRRELSLQSGRTGHSCRKSGWVLRNDGFEIAFHRKNWST